MQWRSNMQHWLTVCCSKLVKSFHVNPMQLLCKKAVVWKAKFLRQFCVFSTNANWSNWKRSGGIRIPNDKNVQTWKKSRLVFQFKTLAVCSFSSWAVSSSRWPCWSLSSSITSRRLADQIIKKTGLQEKKETLHTHKECINMNDSFGSRSLPDTDLSTTTASLDGIHRVNSHNGSVH